MLRHFGIRLKNIFDKNDYNKMGSKGDIITNILNRTKYREAIFIDDSIDHLKSVNDSRVKCYLADWGYTINDTNGIFSKYKY